MSWVKTMFKRAVTAGAVALLTTTGQTSSTSSGGATGLTKSSTPRVAGEPVINKELSDHKPLLPTTPNIEILTSAKDTLLSSGFTTYGDVPELAEVVNEFPSIWEEKGFADLLENEWMRIPLGSDWESKAPKTARVYPLGNESKKIIDQTFDKLHEQGQMEWTSESTPISYPVFAVWTIRLDGTRKGRAAFDIRGLIAITQPDIYALPLQTELISAVKGCSYITVVDCSNFFY